MNPPEHPDHLRSRLVRGTQRRVWLQDNTIVKEFQRISWPGDIRRPWRREHKALKKLEETGVNAPVSFGYKSTGAGVIQLRRKYTEGRILKRLEAKTINAVAAHLSKIHFANVVTCDPKADNFLITKEGELMCIDYGRARVFSHKGPYFYWYVGKEMHRISYALYRKTPELWRPFITSYKAACNYPAWGWKIVRTSLNVCLRRKGLRRQAKEFLIPC